MTTLIEIVPSWTFLTESGNTATAPHVSLVPEARVHELISNLKLALRQQARAPGFAAAASVVLALGIGLNAAMLGLTYSMLFAERPFERPSEIVQLFSHNATEPDSYRAFSYPAWQEISRSAPLNGVMAHRTRPVGLRNNNEDSSRRSLADFVSSNYFSVLGVNLAQGRAFSEEEARAGSRIPVAIVSHKLWRQLGADPALVGGTIRVSERPFTVIGITQPGFTGTSTVIGPEVFLPLAWVDSIGTSFMRGSARSLERADEFDLFLVGRLQEDSSIESTNQGLALTSAALERALPVEYRNQTVSVGPLPRFFSSVNPGQERALAPFSAALLGMTGSVLFIVCLNLASMFLARGQARRREFAVRLALGGGRARIVRQLLTEGLVLSTIGGVLGAILGALAIDAVMGALFEHLPITLAFDTSMPALVAGPTALFALIATLTFALGPAMRHTGSDVITELKQQGGEGAERRRRFLPRHPLVSLQIAFSLGLLICAGLFVRMAGQASLENTTFDANDTVLVEVDASLAGYSDAQGRDLYALVENRLRSAPGTKSASVAVTVPFGTLGMGERVRRAGVVSGPDDPRLSLAEGRATIASLNAVGASYFETLGLRMTGGRVFTDAETQGTGSKRVAIVDEILAKSLWPDGDAIGRMIEFAPADAADAANDPAVPIEVVGIVPMVRRVALEATPTGAVYVPFAQNYRGNVHFHVRTTGPVSDAVLAAVRREIQSVAPQLPVLKVTTFADHADTSLEFWMLGLTSRLLITMAGLAALIAFVGIYGSLSYSVLRRTKEFGIRTAIGASPRDVTAMVIGEGLRLGAVGVSVGLVIGTVMGLLLDSVIIELGAFDALTFTLAPAVLLLACVVAAWLPARRATAVNPAATLRAD